MRRARDNTISAGEGNSFKKLPPGLFVLRGAEKTPKGRIEGRTRKTKVCALRTKSALITTSPLLLPPGKTQKVSKKKGERWKDAEIPLLLSRLTL